MSQNDRLFFRVGSVLLPILVAILLIAEPYSTGFRIFASLVMIGFYWQCQFILRDWKYIKDHEPWSVWASAVHDDSYNMRTTIVHTGAYVHGKAVRPFDIKNLDGKTKHFGRWTVFTDQESGLQLWRDNMPRSRQIFYTMI